MKNRVLMVLMTLLVCCFVQPTAKAMDQPAKISGKTVYDTMANGDFKAITLNPKSKYEFTLSWEDDGPAISINGTRVENVDVTYDEESISLIG
ncbi:MAG TPA: hypothetical protein VK145_01625, partial [Candidatus Nanoarchaeia archaeon]|nr:hypothetical protein [Candidatus Nanoarchaeia archaeon]